MMSFITSMACYVVLSHAVGAQSVEMGQVLHVQLKVDVSIFIKSRLMLNMNNLPDERNFAVSFIWASCKTNESGSFA